jgi:hypothetical protein
METLQIEKPSGHFKDGKPSGHFDIGKHVDTSLWAKMLTLRYGQTCGYFKDMKPRGRFKDTVIQT